MKNIQKESFPEVFGENESFGKSKKGGNLSKIAHCFDEKAVIRIKGNVIHANLKFDQCHPVLLSTKRDMVITMLRDHHFEGGEFVSNVFTKICE